MTHKQKKMLEDLSQSSNICRKRSHVSGQRPSPTTGGECGGVVGLKTRLGTGSGKQIVQ